MSALMLVALIDLNWFDQEKLAQLVEHLPAHVRSRDEEVIMTPVRGVKVSSVFPDTANSSFQISCESFYYNDASYASSATCALSLDLDHRELIKKNDEIRVKIDDELAYSLYGAIPYGRPEREFRSTHKETGTLFTGKKGNIFDYYFKCSEVNCLLRFSGKHLKSLIGS
jgi:hypothetical protein